MSTTGSGGATDTGGRGGGGRAGAGGRGGSGATGGGTGTGGSMGGGGSGVMPAMSSGCGKMPTIASSMYNNGNPIPIMAANRQRRFILSVPTNYDNTKPHKLVIAWHELDGNDKKMYRDNYYGLKTMGDAASTTIFVAPNGEKGGAPCTGTANSGEAGCGWPDSSGSNVALGDAVVALIEENFCIDKNRTFANGWSYGGSMSYRTGCSRPLGGGTATWGVRAIAIYNGNPGLSGNCTPGKPVATYVSHGTQDSIFNHSVGVSMAQTWAKTNGCTWMTPMTASGNHVCANLTGCMMGYPVEFCSFVGGHTAYPPSEGGQPWQAAEVWKFFSQF